MLNSIYFWFFNGSLCVTSHWKCCSQAKNPSKGCPLAYLAAGGRANNFSYATPLVIKCTLYSLEDWTFSCGKPRNFRRGGRQGYIYRSTGMNSLFLKNNIFHKKKSPQNAHDTKIKCYIVNEHLIYFKNFNRFLQSQKWHENNSFVKQSIAKFSRVLKSFIVFVRKVSRGSTCTLARRFNVTRVPVTFLQRPHALSSCPGISTPNWAMPSSNLECDCQYFYQAQINSRCQWHRSSTPWNVKIFADLRKNERH